MDCRWAPLLGAGMDSAEEGLIVLPKYEQVSRGQELLGILQREPHWSSSSESCRSSVGGPKITDIDWNVVVKQTFIEVKIPSGRSMLKRSLSDSALPGFQSETETPWKPDKLQDLSDKSTNASIEAEDLDDNFGGSSSRGGNGLSSDDEVEPDTPQIETDLQIDTDVLVQSPSDYQYVEQWWMPTGYDASASSMCPAMMDPSGMFDGTFMPGSPGMFDASYMGMQWPDQSMGAMDGQCADANETGEEWRTTVMIRNMPNNYTREMLLELVDAMGFEGAYDFAYLPIDFQTQSGLGYAFINFVSVAEAQLCFEQFEGFCDWKVPSEKVCTVTWSSPTQGFEAHIERYQNSPVMHQSLPDEWKPVLFQQGVRVAFPPPTKPIKTPKVRQHPSVKNA